MRRCTLVLLVAGVYAITGLFATAAFADRFTIVKPGEYSTPNGVVLDKDTGLMWTQNAYDVHGILDHRRLSIKDFLKKSSQGDCRDWRLPTAEELRTISLPTPRMYDPFVPRDGQGWEGKDLLSLTYLTNESLNEYLYKVYLPTTDTTFVDNINADQAFVYLRLVRGRLKAGAKIPSKFYDFGVYTTDLRFNDKVKQFVMADGFATFGGHLTRPILVPLDQDRFRRLTFAPITAVCFAEMNNEQIDKLDMERHILGNKVFDIAKCDLNLSNILGFYDLYGSIRNMNKFDLSQRKEDIINELKEAKESYSQEFDKYVKSTFVLVPFQEWESITDKKYNMDAQQVEVDFGKYYGRYVAGSHEPASKGIPLFVAHKLSLSLDNASKLFKNSTKVEYTYDVYAYPLDSKAREFLGMGYFVKAIVVHFRSDDKLRLSIVMHNPRNTLTKEGRFEKLSYDYDLVSYD
jgi:hypothetical protein